MSDKKPSSHLTVFRALAAPSICCLVGCATSVSTLQGPRPAAPGRPELIAGASLPIHGAYVSKFNKGLDRAAERLEGANTNPLSEAEERELVDAALAGILYTPTAIPEVGFRMGIVDRLDAGLRWAGPAFKLDGKYHVYRTDDGLNLAVTLGYGYHTGIGASIASGIYDVFDSLKLVDYSRHDIDTAVLVGNNDRRTFSGYGALRGIVSLTSFSSSLPEELLGPDGVVDIDTSSPMIYLGATGGFRLGSPRFAWRAEMTLMHCWFRPRVLGEARNLSGLVIAPATGFDISF